MSQPKHIWEYTDAELAGELHWRMVKRLGDPRVGVSGKVSEPFAGWPEASHPTTLKTSKQT
jgi:hypothetical protein